MPNLYLTCKACGREFFSGVDLPPPEARPHECTWCHEAPEYSLDDYVVGYAEAAYPEAAAYAEAEA